jgi:hypothetical protein
MGLSDFTDMGALGITIAGEPFSSRLSRHNYLQDGYIALSSRPRSKRTLRERPPCRVIQARTDAG